MPSAVDVALGLHLAVLSVFVGGSSVLMLGAILRRLRVRRPLLVWRTGPLPHVPLGPSLFLGIVCSGLLCANTLGWPVPASAAIGYPAGGLFWFVAVWVARSILVTEYGIVPDLPRPQRAVAWSQIVDYVVTARDGRPHLVVFFRDRESGARRRLDLAVPDRRAEDLRAVLEAKLDGRLSVPADVSIPEPSDPPNDSPRGA
jgi:hypothetical protein